MSKKLTEISPDLTIPGFDVTVHNPHSCQVKSQDGRHEFSVEIDKSRKYRLTISASNSWSFCLGAWKWCGIEYTTDADDVITHFANSLKLMDQLSSEGFSAKIDRGLVLSHPSKPGYQLRMGLGDARKIVPLKNTSVYTWVEYRGPAYDYSKANINLLSGLHFLGSERLIVTNKGLEELAEELKARILSLGEKAPGIAQWVKGEIESALAPQGFTFTPKPEKAIVEFSHPTGLSGSLSFAPFTAFTAGGDYDINPKYPNPQFPTDIGTEKVVLFTLDRRNYREPYTKGFLEKNPQEVIHEFRRFLALPLVYQEVCDVWKSDILVPKLNGNSLQLVNTKIEGDDSIVLELTVEEEKEKDKLALKNKDQKDYYEISDDPGEIAQTIVGLAETHVQEFIQANGLTTKIIEIDF
jgi:hypothetical protein